MATTARTQRKSAPKTITQPRATARSKAAISRTPKVERPALSSKEVMDVTFRMPWGQLYDPEILLEHAIVHLLRHRRQLEQWRSPSG